MKINEVFSPLDEKWSQKYKSSINCANPRGFSQRAHCQGRKKNEAFGGEFGRYPVEKDYQISPKTQKEKISDLVMAIGATVGAIAGYKLTPTGFWGTAGGMAAGLFLGSLPGRFIAKDATSARVKKAQEISNQLSTDPQIKQDFQTFLTYLFNDTPKEILTKNIALKSNYSLIGIDNVDSENRSLRSARQEDELRKFVKHYDQEWSSLAKKYNVGPITLGMTFDKIYGHSVMDEWFILLKKHFQVYNEPMQKPFTGQQNESVDDSVTNKFVKKFLPWVAEQLGIRQLPKIELLDRPMNTSFGTYDADNNCLYLVTAGRHPIDVLRTLAHELTHHKQNLAGQLDINSGDTGTDEENEANANAGIIMRDFASANPEYFGMDETIQVNKPTELAVQQNYTPPRNPSTKKINATPAVKLDIRNSKPDPNAQTYKPK
jgi:hypothetical protein